MIDMTGRFRLGYKKDSTMKIPNDKSLDELINLIEDSITFDEYVKFKSKGDFNFPGEGTGNWNDCNINASPKEWLAIYKFSEEYNNWAVRDKLSIPQHWDGNILDFGAGSGVPWNPESIKSDINLYLFEINMSIVNDIKKQYTNFENVHIVSSFQDIKHLKFNYIHSRDVIEHVRHVNEHLDVLYHLGADNSYHWYKIDGQPQPGHVLNLHSDTMITEFWQQFKITDWCW